MVDNLVYCIKEAVAAQEKYCEKHDVPNFALQGYCFRCGQNVYSKGGYSVNYASSNLVTSCPWCHTSFCE